MKENINQPLFEAPQNSTPNEQEGPESVFETIIHRSPVVGSGKDGIILKVDTTTLDESVIEQLRSEGIDLEQGDFAIKVIKIYRPGTAQKEYDLHTKAYNILSKIEDTANIPKPILIKKCHINSVDSHFLNKYGAVLEDEAEIIVMDFIDGKDIATIIYDYILEKNRYDDSMINNLDFDSKQEIVNNILQFTTPSNRVQGDFRDIISMRDNVRKLLDYLRSKNFSFDSAVLDQLKKSIEVLESNGIFHNDLHERNIMIDSNGKPYIIDFGKTVTDRSDMASDDFAIIKRLESLKQRGDSMDDIENFKRSAERTLKSPKMGEMMATFKTQLEAGQYDRIINNIASSAADQSRFLQLLTVIANIYLSSDRTELKNSILSMLDKIAMQTKQIYAKKDIEICKKYISSKI